VPVRDRTPEDDQPLARPVNEQPLARAVGGEQEEASQAEGDGAEPRREERTAPGAEGSSQGEQGPVTRAMNKAQENNWVYDSVAEKARETGLLDKADEFLSKARNRLGGG
jgi:hypothetical protein